MYVSVLVVQILLGLGACSGQAHPGMTREAARLCDSVSHLTMVVAMINVTSLHSVSALLSALITELRCVEYADHSGRTVQSFKESRNHCVILPSPSFCRELWLSITHDWPIFRSSGVQISQMCCVHTGSYLLNYRCSTHFYFKGSN